MNRFAVWIVLVLAVVAAATLAIVHFKPSPAGLGSLVSPGPLSPKHAYLANQCTSCHQPTVGVTVARCTPCHASSERLLGRQPTAFHESVKECAACHVEHQKKSIRPRVMDHAELARVGARTLEGAAPKDPDSAATLHSLETWLKVSSSTEFDETSALQVLNCAGCHDRRDPHFKRFGDDCAQCHSFQTWTVPGYQHPSPRSKECVQCHQPPPSHLMGHFSMISQKFANKERARVDECFECHNTTSWNDIVGVGFYKHH